MIKVVVSSVPLKFKIKNEETTHKLLEDYREIFNQLQSISDNNLVQIVPNEDKSPYDYKEFVIWGTEICWKYLEKPSEKQIESIRFILDSIDDDGIGE